MLDIRKQQPTFIYNLTFNHDPFVFHVLKKSFQAGMPAWDMQAMDFLPMCSSMLLERCTLQKLNSSDDDSVDSGSLPWVDETTFEELDAYLHENPPGWSPRCECEDSRLSLCSFCLSNSTDGFFSLPADDANRPELLTANEPVQDPSNFFFIDRLLYPEMRERDDLVVLGVDLQALSSAVLCNEENPNPSSGNIPSRQLPNYNKTFSVGGQQDCTRLLTPNNKQATALQEWYSTLGPVTSNAATFGVAPTPKTAPQRQRRGGGRRGTAIPEEDKIFPCPYAGCARVYSKNSHLRAHLRRHTGEKPFVCQWPGCKWRFSRSDELARHKRSHSGVKPYQCTVCGKRFGRSDHLAKHVRIHRKQGYVVPPKTKSVKVQILTPRA